MSLDTLFDRNRRYAFLAGAGISCESPSNLLLANQFIAEIIKQITSSDVDRDTLLQELRNNRLRFEQVLAAVHHWFDRDLHVLDLLDACHAPNDMHCALAAAGVAGHVVLTTNFDSLIEIAAVRMQNPLEVKFRQEDFEACNHDLCRAVSKIHGTLRDGDGRDARRSIVATVAQVGRLGKGQSLSTWRCDLLALATATQDLVVVGYSGSDGFDIVPALGALPDHARMFWVFHSDVPGLVVHSYEAFTGRPIAAIEDILAQGNWSPDQIHVITGRTATILHIVAAKLGLAWQPQEPTEHSAPAFYFTDWRYEHALEPWKCLRVVSQLYLDLGRWDRATDCLEKATRIADELQDIPVLDQLHTSMSYANILANRFSDAQRALDASEALRQRLGQEAGPAQLHHLALCRTAERNYDEASALIERLVSTHPDWAEESTVLHLKGRILLGQNRRTEALECLLRAVKRSQEAGELSSTVRAYIVIAGIHGQDGRYLDALDCIYEALSLTDMTKQVSEIGDLYLLRARTFIQLNLLGAALRDLDRASAHYSATPTRHEREDIELTRHQLRESLNRILQTMSGERNQSPGHGGKPLIMAVCAEERGSLITATDEDFSGPMPEEVLDPLNRRARAELTSYLFDADRAQWTARNAIISLVLHEAGVIEFGTFRPRVDARWAVDCFRTDLCR